MDAKTFGLAALDLVKAATFPGTALEAAMEFKKLAIELAEGRLIVCAATPSVAPPPQSTSSSAAATEMH